MKYFQEKYREIEVRTPLHESIGKAYSSFEPDKQEVIRQEIGSKTTSIRNLLDRFQHAEPAEDTRQISGLQQNHFNYQRQQSEQLVRFRAMCIIDQSQAYLVAHSVSPHPPHQKHTLPASPALHHACQ
jgi:hypothetical protein